jgi:hypothetical protein
MGPRARVGYVRSLSMLDQPGRRGRRLKDSRATASRARFERCRRARREGPPGQRQRGPRRDCPSVRPTTSWPNRLSQSSTC